jgi:hypothetical protein
LIFAFDYSGFYRCLLSLVSNSSLVATTCTTTVSICTAGLVVENKNCVDHLQLAEVNDTGSVRRRWDFKRKITKVRRNQVSVMGVGCHGVFSGKWVVPCQIGVE